jgi:hypothetical protein
MTSQDWQILLGTLISAVLTLAPWMFMVHAKLAVVASRMGDLSAKFDKATDAQRELWSMCAAHGARLENHDVQIAHLAHHLEELQ